jgi:O-antigen ligase
VPRVSHEYLYPVFLGTAMALCGPAERDRVMGALRNSFFLFMVVSVLLVAVMPAMVLDRSYSQGLLPGVPRFGGLASHPVGMGMLAATALLVLWAHPFERRWLSIASWLLGLGVLFIAQSKTAWVAFLVGAICMVAVRQLPDSMARMSDPRQSSFGVVLCLAVIALVLVMLASFLVADLPGVIAGFFDSAQGAQLMSMTGRDRIWIVAMDEWQHNPVFGYGLTIWDSAYRQAIGMPFATHAHNQMMDSLSRSGSIGAIGLIFYAVVLMVLAFRHARSSGGLSVALFTVLALLSISEVPLMLIGYGLDVLPHMMLLTSIAAGAAGRRPVPTVVSPIAASFRTTRSA